MLRSVSEVHQAPQHMKTDLAKRAKGIIAKILYITIATVTKDGKPWNSPVYCAFDKDYNFYWASWKENQHSQNIREKKDVFLVIYDSTAPAGTGEGVYILAKAYELENKEEIEKALVFLYGRENRKPKPASQFLDKHPRRIYKAIPEKVWMNGDGQVDGEYIDIRTEVKL